MTETTVGTEDNPVISQHCRQLLEQHGLTTWRVKFNTKELGVVALGWTDFEHRTIHLDGGYLTAAGPERGDAVILHEIAHALAGPDVEDHGPEWQAIARAIGAAWSMRSSDEQAKARPGPGSSLNG